MQTKNEEIRTQAKNKNIKHWQIADYLGISEATLTRKLRHDLSPEEKERVLKAIEKIKEGER